MKKFLTLFAFLVAAGWTNAQAVDWNWKGDVRYRYEIQDFEGVENNRDRHRIRARFGVYPWINEELSAGIRLATGKTSDPVSRNQTLGEDFGAKNILLDEAFIDYHPMSYGLDGKVNFLLGKREVKSTLIRVNDLVWDSDLTLEGLTFQFGKDGSKQKSGLNLVAGYYFIDELSSSEDDPFFWAAQAAYTGEAGPLGFMAGAGFYDFQIDEWCEPVDYNVLELFANIGGKFNGDLPWKAYGQYAVNVAEDVDDDNNGYLVGFTLGKAKNVGEWAIDVNYSYLEKDAVVGEFTDSDRWGGGTDGEGIEVGGTYHLVQNMTVGLKYLSHSTGVDSDASDDGLDIWQADMVVKF
ncbi:MAG: hypothetical protein C1942_07480 [Prosthecochloris sp.]|uniref:putative porin n=1 Tax=Prosthecochloris sp. TaxID=290513 RepID=UPI0013CA177E|nr:putative porin [Prosthecochloris sp.]NEX12512.1 hypothetical protein [Prosthecochloris sp.]